MARLTADGVEIGDGPVLVTGAAGFVGRHLMEHLKMGPGDFASDVSEDFPAPDGVTKLAWRLPALPPGSLGPVRHVVHLAALSSVSKSLGETLDVYTVNVAGAVSVLEYAASRCSGARILLVSSAEVYGSAGGRIAETAPIRPQNPYGGSKAAAEVAARQFEISSGLDIVVARPFPHFGPYQARGFALPSFAARIAQAVKEGRPEIVAGNLAPVRDFTYVTDVASAYGILLARGGRGEVYNVGSGEPRSISDMLGLLLGISGAKLSVRMDPSLLRPSDVSFQVCDPSKLEGLGWKRRVPVEKGLSELLRWWEDRV